MSDWTEYKVAPAMIDLDEDLPPGAVVEVKLTMTVGLDPIGPKVLRIEDWAGHVRRRARGAAA